MAYAPVAEEPTALASAPVAEEPAAGWSALKAAHERALEHFEAGDDEAARATLAEARATAAGRADEAKKYLREDDAGFFDD